jgi:hypothetical protein
MCPKRYAFLMTMASLYEAHQELHWGRPEKYLSAFLGVRYMEPPFVKDHLLHIVSQRWMPAVNGCLVMVLRKDCYPSQETQRILGPLLAKKLSLFSPFFDMVPPDGSDPVKLPNDLERVTGAMSSCWYSRYQIAPGFSFDSDEDD